VPGGYSLTEIIVVVAIIAVLIAVTLPAVGRVREASQLTVCTANLKTLHQATLNYALDHDGFLPVAKNPNNNFAITLACEGYLGLSGDGFWDRLSTWVALAQRRAPFCLWCPAADQAEKRPAYNMATYCMNLNVGGASGLQPGLNLSTLRTMQVDKPGKTALYMDGCFLSGSGYMVWVGESGFLPSAPHPPSLYKQTNNSARAVNVVFLDGHVECRPIGTIPTNFEDPFWKVNAGP
jgi:prepilin-type N-terminal cleavage/methylation domain-containing protein/prepilin-type processing-associated H-X9-DG protein